MLHSAAPTETEEIVTRYADTVLRAAYAMVKNRQDAEDIAQEVFISLIKTHPHFESDEHCKAWLLRAAINRSKSFFRSAWQQKTQGLAEDTAAPCFTPAENTVLEAVHALPQKYRQVIYLYYIEGYAAKELAALLHLPQNTVLSQLARGRALLKTALKGDFDDV